jgi:hypothetical protein|tara:strand:- start:3165 stop:3311 length:147 start_codon:yes stop_codon:yes gene_type:complete
MIKNILDLLALSNGETENIRIAKGKYALPKDLKSAYKKLKNNIKWQRQ